MYDFLHKNLKFYFSRFKEISDSSKSAVFESDSQAAEQSSQRISDKLPKQSSQSIDENSETRSCWEEKNVS